MPERVKFCYNPVGQASARVPALCTVAAIPPAAPCLEICRMKLFRLGTGLALLTLGLGCTQASQSITSPSAVVGGPVADAADGSTLKVTAPALVSPVDGSRAEDRRPTLIWLNSTGKYDAIGVAYDLEVSSPAATVYARTVGESPNMGAHLVEPGLDYDIVYSWRARARVGDLFGPWSSWASFMSPTRPTGTAPVGGGAVASTGGCAA